jgi:hypothetical protein
MITRKCERCGQESDGWRYCLTCARGMYHGWKKNQVPDDDATDAAPM